MTQFTLPAEIIDNISTARLPAIYEQAKLAISACADVDECREWSDKAAALASYARQADDVVLENFARKIRARAVRRCGELLQDFDGRGGDRSKSEGPLFGCLCVLSLGMVASHAEPAGPDDVTITAIPPTIAIA